MNVIFGATGRVGGAAAAALRRRGLPVRAVVRDATRAAALTGLGAELAIADLHDRAAIGRALAGATRALVICPLSLTAPDVRADTAQILDALAAGLAAARPGSVVAISDYGAHHVSGTGLTEIFHALERDLAAACVPITFLRSAEHMQNWRRQAAAARTRGVVGSLHHPLDKRFPTVSAHDVGQIAAELMLEPPPGARPRIVHVEGPARVTAIEVAEVIAQLLGRAVEARAVPRAHWRPILAAGGLGDSYAELVCALQDAHNAGRIDLEPGVGDVRRGTTPLAAALRDELG
jgi:uncharacterized protein YbjT (DUF2867 family)